MGTLSHLRAPTDRLTVVQAILDLFAQSPAFRDAVISDPFIGPGGAVILDVKIGQETAFRVVAPTADEAYAVLYELVACLDLLRTKREGGLAQHSSEVSVWGGTRGALPGAGPPSTN